MKKLIEPGHVVMAFKTSQDAEKAREKLLANRFAGHEITEWSDAEVVANLREALSKAMAMDYRRAEERFLTLAQQGAGFLVLEARSESEYERAIELVREFGLEFAEKYGRFAMHDVPA